MNSKRLGNTIIIGLIAASAGMLSGKASAYVLSGRRWAGQPTSGCCASLTYKPFTTSSFLDSSNYNAFTNALYYWSAYSGRNSNVNWNSNSSSIATMKDINAPGAPYDGTCNDTPSSGTGTFTKIDVFLNNAYTSAYPWQKRTGLAAHEIGHALGLDHSTSFCALMVDNSYDRWENCGTIYPFGDDLNGSRALY